MRADPEELEAAIGYRFQNRAVFRRALTHRSGAYESAGLVPHNEQLEFLGDSILGFLISESLVRQFPSYREGALSKLKAHLGSAKHLHEVASKLNLGSYLELGKGEEMTGGRGKRTLLANALEALIAALYLDGGIETAREFVERFVTGGPITAPEHLDLKGELQELAQSRRLPPPRYSLVGVRGPEHAKTFTVEVRVGNGLCAQGEGSSKKAASQEAARLILQRVHSTG